MVADIAAEGGKATVRLSEHAGGKAYFFEANVSTAGGPRIWVFGWRSPPAYCCSGPLGRCDGDDGPCARAARLHGQTPSISTSSEKLRNVLTVR